MTGQNSAISKMGATPIQFDRQAWLELWAEANDLPNPAKKQALLNQYTRSMQRLLVEIDYHYIWYSLGRNCADDIINSVIGALHKIGEMVSINAYANWQRLRQESQTDFQHRLAELGLETHYVLDRSNTVSTVMVKHLQDVLGNKHRNIDTVAIVGGADELKPVIDLARMQDKQVFVLACSHNFGNSLRQGADQVIFLDNHTLYDSHHEIWRKNYGAKNYFPMVG